MTNMRLSLRRPDRSSQSIRRDIRRRAFEVTAAVAGVIAAVRLGERPFEAVAAVLARPLLVGGVPPDPSTWQARQVFAGSRGPIVEDSLDVGAGGGARPLTGQPAKTVRVLRDVATKEEVQRLLDLAQTVPYNAVDHPENPVATPMEVLNHDGVWRTTKPLAVAVQDIVEARLLPYMREELGCPSLVAAYVMVRRYAPHEQQVYKTHFDHNALGTAVMDLTPEPDSGLFIGTGADASTQFFVPFSAPGDVVVHGWDIVHGVRLKPDHQRISIILWAKPADDVKHNTTSWFASDELSGNADASFRLGLEAEDQGKLKEAKVNLQHAAENGHPFAMQRLTSVLERLGDLEGMEHWLSQAVVAGVSIAQVDAGDGLRRSGDPIAASELYEAAAAQGDGVALLRLSAAAVFGMGRRADMARGLLLLEEAATTGLSSAKHMLEQLEQAEKGEDIENARGGFLWKAADRHLPDALLAYALAEHEQGHDDETMRLLRAASSLGHAGAVAALAALT